MGAYLSNIEEDDGSLGVTTAPDGMWAGETTAWRSRRWEYAAWNSGDYDAYDAEDPPPWDTTPPSDCRGQQRSRDAWRQNAWWQNASRSEDWERTRHWENWKGTAWE